MAIREILIPVDFSETSQLATTAGLALARRLGAHATIIHVIEPLPQVGLATSKIELYERELMSHRSEKLEALLASVRTEGLHPTPRIVKGDVGLRLLAAAAELETQLIVMGSLGASAGEPFLLGSIAVRVVRDARCPVLVVRRPHAERLPPDGLFRRPLVAVDYSRFSAPAARLAARLSEPGATIELYHTMFRPTIEPQLGEDVRMFDAAFEVGRNEAVEKLRHFGDSLGLDRPLECVVDIGRASRTIGRRLERAGIDLVIAGAHGREGSADLLLGTVADRLLRSSPAPVLLIPDRAL